MNQLFLPCTKASQSFVCNSEEHSPTLLPITQELTAAVRTHSWNHKIHALPASGTTKSQGRHPSAHIPAKPWPHGSVSQKGTIRTCELSAQSRHARCWQLCQTPSDVSPSPLQAIRIRMRMQGAFLSAAPSTNKGYFSAVYMFTTFLHTHLTDEGVAMPIAAFVQESCWKVLRVRVISVRKKEEAQDVFRESSQPGV